jgi:hypothetical protein
MTSTSHQPRPAIEAEPPHATLLRVVNPVFAAMLRSPLHRLLDVAFRPRLLVLRLPGRRTGRTYDIVVARHDLGGVVSVLTNASWRLNARGGTDAEVTCDGVTRRARAVLVEDPDEVADAYAAEIRRIGRKAARRHLGVRITVERMPTHAELVDGVRREHLSLIRLRPA